MARTNTLDEPVSDPTEACAPPPLDQDPTVKEQLDASDDDSPTLTQYVDTLQRQSFIRQLERRTIHSRDQDA